MVHNVVVLINPEDEGPLVQAINSSAELDVVRRCADLAEVRAAVRSRVADLAVLDGTDPDLDARIIEDLHASRAGVVLVAPPPNLPGLARLGADGAAASGAAEHVVESLLAVIRSRPTLPLQEPFLEGIAVYPTSGAGARPWTPTVVEGPPAPSLNGRIIVVWGTSGAPGRSTVALSLASALARRGRTLLIDADTTNPSIAHMLGLPVDASSLSALIRQASRAELTAADIDAATARVSGGLSVLTGLVTPHRWREVGPKAMVEVLEASRTAARWIVVDTAAVGLDAVPDEIRHQGSRDDVTAAVLRSADRVLCVIRGDVTGLNRLTHVRAWWDDLGTGRDLDVIVNRLSTAGAGPRPINAVQAALAPLLAGRTIRVVPEDQAVPAAMLKAVSVTEAFPASAVAQAVEDLADAVSGAQRAPEHRRRRARVPH